MNKAVIVILGVIALAVVGFFALNHYIYQEKQEDNRAELEGDINMREEGEFR